MELVEFMKEAGRMCTSYGIVCFGCPVYEFRKGQTCGEAMRNHPEKFVKAVEKWSNEHPIITNRQKFREVFGENACPTVEWWGEEFKPPKGE